MQTIRVANWEELVQQLWAGSWRADLRRNRPSFAFRGMSATDDLRTSLMRMGAGYWRVEGPMLRAFRKYARGEGGSLSSLWDWLSLAQHHGLPTRLLDWTHSPFVAMHFATCGRPEQDGVIWRVDYRRTNARLPKVLKRVLAGEEADVFTAEMLEHAVASLDALEGLSRRPFALFFEPPSLDARIVNQFALFSLMSSARARMDEWFEASRDEVAIRVVIPAQVKRQVRDLLDQGNVNERVLFPGLDGLSQYLKRYYLPAGD